jgi:RNA polymerase sigma-70 factor (ECF subfamily)
VHTTAEAEEREAIIKLKKGDIGGLEVLVRRYQLQALRVAYLVTRNYPQAEDIVQTAFLRVYEHIHAFDSSRPFQPWFLRSVINAALTSTTSLTGRSEVSLDSTLHEHDWLPGSDPEPGERLEAMETRAEVLAALDALSPEQRVSIIMRYYLDWSDVEVAQKLKIPAGTVRRRLHDARRRLRSLLPT